MEVGEWMINRSGGKGCLVGVREGVFSRGGGRGV